jgi:hypothetical protein
LPARPTPGAKSKQRCDIIESGDDVVFDDVPARRAGTLRFHCRPDACLLTVGRFLSA